MEMNHDDIDALGEIFGFEPAIDTTALEAFVECDSQIFHTTQVATARKLLNKFTRTQLVLLLAEMQSGKTGTFLCLACAMIYYGKVDIVYVFTGVSDTDLFAQLELSVSTAVNHFNDVLGCDISGKVVAKKSSHLETLTIPIRTLMIWDESHYAQDTRNRPFKMFHNNALLVDGTARTNELWKHKECYLLTVSATPFSEYADARDRTIHTELTKEIVTMKPGSTYRGVQYYYENNCIETSWDISSVSDSDFDTEQQMRFVNMLRNAKKVGQPQYALLRSRATPTTIKSLAEQSNWNVKFYDMKNRGTLDGGWASLDDAPPSDTLIVLKNMGRLGQVIPKKHIAFVFESSSSSSSSHTGATDTVLQSLLGRMCGYGPFNPNGTKIYISESLLKTNPLKDKIGSDKALEARRRLKLKEMQHEHEQILRDRTRDGDDFAVDVENHDYLERVRNELCEIERDHYESVSHVEASELVRYVKLMNRDHKDIPRYAKNIKRTSIDQKTVGHFGYSTVPFLLHVAMSTDTDRTGNFRQAPAPAPARTEAEAEADIDPTWTALEHCARKMNVKGGARRLTHADKMAVVVELLSRLDATPEAFGDVIQREEITCLLKSIVNGEFNVTDIINFGDLNSARTQRLRSRFRIQEAILNQMPYHEAIRVTQWRRQEEQGKAIRLQLQICSKLEEPSQAESEGEGGAGVNDFDHTHTLYFTGYTYDASDHTKEAHIRSTIPETTCQEAFHHSHELTLTPLTPSTPSTPSTPPTLPPSTWVLINDEHAFMALLDTEFPASHKVRVLLSEDTIPSTVTSHLNHLCLRNNGRFVVKRVAGRRTTKECMLGTRPERYDVYFHTRTKLSFV